MNTLRAVLGPLLMVLGTGCFLYGMAHYAFVAMWSGLSNRAIGPRPTVLQATARLRDRDRARHPDQPGVTIVMPMFNESALIVDTVGAVLRSSYREIEVMVVNDGSTDNSLELLTEHYGLVALPGPLPPQPVRTKPVHTIYRSRVDPRLVVVDKDNGGSKADSSNAAINFASKPWMVIMDADELVPPDAVGLVMNTIMSTPGNVVGAGVSLLPSNNCVVDGGTILDDSVSWNYWLGCQTVEYATAFCLSRPGMAHIGALPIVSGGFGVYRADVLRRVGGYSHPHLGEDLDVLVRIHRMLRDAGEDYTVVQVPDAVIFTEFPDSRAILRRQRVRWHRGLRQVVHANRDLVGNRRYGTFGTLGMTMMYGFEWVAPFIEGAGYVIYAVALAARLIDPQAAAAMILLSQTVGTLITTGAVGMSVARLDWYRRRSDVMKLLVFAVASQWGYRQLTLVWRLRSLVGKHTGWGAMPRAGFKSAPAPR